MILLHTSCKIKQHYVARSSAWWKLVEIHGIKKTFIKLLQMRLRISLETNQHSISWLHKSFMEKPDLRFPTAEPNQHTLPVKNAFSC